MIWLILFWACPSCRSSSALLPNAVWASRFLIETCSAKVSTQGYAETLAATQARFGQGLASLVELEDARRNALASESAQLSLSLERNRAWVSVYRALGGGFEPPASAATPNVTSN